MICDTIHYVNNVLLKTDKKVLVEGANATMLDIDFGKLYHQMANVTTDVKISHCTILVLSTSTTTPPSTPHPNPLLPLGDSKIYL